MTDQRSKIISFRVSWQEYNKYRIACEAYGARSISDLARMALMQLDHNFHNPTDTQFNDTLLSKMSELISAVERIGTCIGQQRAVDTAREPPD